MGLQDVTASSLVTIVDVDRLSRVVQSRYVSFDYTSERSIFVIDDQYIQVLSSMLVFLYSQNPPNPADMEAVFWFCIIGCWF